MQHVDGYARMRAEFTELLPIERALQWLKPVRKYPSDGNDSHGRIVAWSTAAGERYASRRARPDRSRRAVVVDAHAPREPVARTAPGR